MRRRSSNRRRRGGNRRMRTKGGFKYRSVVGERF